MCYDCTGCQNTQVLLLANRNLHKCLIKVKLLCKDLQCSCFSDHLYLVTVKPALVTTSI
jgi:hypothetical protein